MAFYEDNLLLIRAEKAAARLKDVERHRSKAAEDLLSAKKARDRDDLAREAEARTAEDARRTLDSEFRVSALKLREEVDRIEARAAGVAAECDRDKLKAKEAMLEETNKKRQLEEMELAMEKARDKSASDKSRLDQAASRFDANRTIYEANLRDLNVTEKSIANAEVINRQFRQILSDAEEMKSRDLVILAEDKAKLLDIEAQIETVKLDIRIKKFKMEEEEKVLTLRLEKMNKLLKAARFSKDKMIEECEARKAVLDRAKVLEVKAKKTIDELNILEKETVETQTDDDGFPLENSEEETVDDIFV